MGKGQRIPPLTDESPMLFRPSLAALFGIEGALVLERAHELQCARGGFEARFGRVCFFWSVRQRNEDFGRIIKRMSLERVIKRITGLDDEAILSDGPRDPLAYPLWRCSLKGKKKPDQGWFGVNYEAIGRACPLFPIASVGLANPLKLSTLPAQTEQNSDQNEHKPAQFEHASRTRSTLNSIQKASLLASDLSEGQKAAVAAMAIFGIERLAAIDLLTHAAPGPDGAASVLAWCESMRRMTEAGYKFYDRKGTNYLYKAILKGHPAPSEAVVAQRVANQRSESRRPAGTPNQPPESEQAKERALAERFRRQESILDVQSPLEWEALIERARPIWAELYEEAFPAERTRSNAMVRAIVRGLLFPVAAGVPS